MIASDVTGAKRQADRLALQLASHIERVRSVHGGPVVVAIDGRSGVGKSTIAAHLAQTLDAALVSSDDFFAGGTAVLPFDAEKLADICVDRAGLHSVLATLKAGREAAFAPFDWDAFDGSLAASERAVAPRPVVIAEGVYTAHPELRNVIDIAVLIETSPGERERRLQQREGVLDAWELQWHRAEDWYFEWLAPPGTFDVVFDNS